MSAGPRAASPADLDAITEALEAACPGAVARNVPAADLGTYRVGGPIAVLVRVVDDEALVRVAEAVRARRPPVLVIGRGSNLLVADQGFAGVGIVLGGAFDAVTITPDRTRVRAGGATALPVLARRAAARGAGGLEFFVGIPGSVGGAVRMNAGGHGRETGDVLESARVFDLIGGGVEVRSARDLALGYRRSALAPSEVVVAAELRCSPDDPAVCAARLDAVVHWRREHQPGGANVGSVFRNPPEDTAGRLIDATGCKGLRVGGAVVSTKHANFFQAEPGATADDVRRLVLLVQERVAAHTGIVLEPELVMVGFEEGR